MGLLEVDLLLQVDKDWICCCTFDASPPSLGKWFQPEVSGNDVRKHELVSRVALSLSAHCAACV